MKTSSTQKPYSWAGNVAQWIKCLLCNLTTWVQSLVPIMRAENQLPKVVLLPPYMLYGMFAPVLHTHTQTDTCKRTFSFTHIHIINFLFKNIYTQNYTTTCTTGSVILRIILSGYLPGRRKIRKIPKLKNLSKVKWIIELFTITLLLSWRIGMASKSPSSTLMKLPCHQWPPHWGSLMLQTKKPRWTAAMYLQQW